MTLQKTESFVPLTTAPAGGEQREFRATIIPQSEQTGAFQSLEAQVVAAAGATPVAGRIHEPRVALQREGDRVVTIHIQCTCGQVMDLACVYDEPPKQP